MADTETKIEALEQEAVAEATNPQADAPKKNAVAAEPNPLSNEAEDLGPAVVKSTDSNPDATKKVSKVSDEISATADKGGSPDTAGKPDTDAGVTKISHPGQTAKVEETENSEDEVVNEGEMPAGLKKYLDKKADKEGDKEEGYKSKKEEIDVTEHVDALVAGSRFI